MTNSHYEIQGGDNDGLENVIDFPTLQAVPNFVENCDLSTIHPEFYASLSDVSDANLINGLEYRKYQLDATRAIRDGMLNGVSKGQMIVGTGGGKTSIAMNFIEQTRGRNLYVAPSRIAVQRAQDEIGKLGMTRTAQRMEGTKFDPSAGITFATWQMLLAGDRYKDIPPDLFSLCVFDEAHHFLGPKVRQLVNHFQSYQLHMTATPDNVATSLSSVVPNNFFRYSSDDLVKNDGFPPWLLYRHDVENERLDQAEVVGDRFAIKEGREGEFLNMSHRYVICTSILRERIPQGSKAIVYLPSINSSKMFVEEVVKKDPVLRQYANKIVHVDGAMSHNEIEDIEKRFRLPPGHPKSILAVCGKDLWTESLDVKDIADIVLADPCASPRVFLQRIGRGSRPAEGKTHVRIHDVVSTLNRLNSHLAQGSKRPLTVAGMMQLQKYYPGIVLNGPYSGMYWDTAGTDQSAGQYQLLPKVSSRMIHFTERNLDLAFLQDQRHAYALFEKFAERLYTNVFTLAFHPEPFFPRGEEINLKRADGTGFKMTLQDFFDATEFFGTIDSVKNRVLQGADALREEIRKGFPISMRLSMGGCSEAEKE